MTERQGDIALGNQPSVPDTAAPQSALQENPAQSTLPVATAGPLAVPNWQPSPPLLTNTNSVNTTVNVGGPTIVVAQDNAGPSLILRFFWFVLVGWWASGLAIIVAYLSILTVIGIPLAFYIFNRIGAIQTLRPRKRTLDVQLRDGVTHISHVGSQQIDLWKRAVYFVLVGWWLGAAWLTVAWVISLGIITIPLSIWMMDRCGEIITLQRN
jgi:uncharacterized membrane protein YccF (DUF307 family)